MEKKHIGYAWFGGHSEIGIVMCIVDGKPKAYMSAIVGLDIEDDIKLVMDWGSKFPIPEAASLIKKIGTISDPEAWKEAGLSTE